LPSITYEFTDIRQLHSSMLAGPYPRSHSLGGLLPLPSGTSLEPQALSALYARTVKRAGNRSAAPRSTDASAPGSGAMTMA